MSGDVVEAPGAAGLTPAEPTAAEPAAEPTPPVDLDDPREQVEVGVLMADGRLAGRRFASRAEAEAWARPEDGEQVVEYDMVCECSV